MSIDKSETLQYPVKQYVARYHVEIDHHLLCQEWRGIALSNMPDGSLDIDALDYGTALDHTRNIALQELGWTGY